MFKHYLEALSRFQANEDDPFSVRFLITLKKDIQQDLLEAFELGQPFVEKYPQLYDESSSFVDFMFKLLEVEEEKKKKIDCRPRPDSMNTSNDSLKTLYDTEIDIRNTVEKLNEDIGEVLKKIDEKYQIDQHHFNSQNEALKTYLTQFSGTMHDFNAMFSDLKKVSKKWTTRTSSILALDDGRENFGRPAALLSGDGCEHNFDIEHDSEDTSNEVPSVIPLPGTTHHPNDEKGNLMVVPVMTSQQQKRTQYDKYRQPKPSIYPPIALSNDPSAAAIPMDSSPPIHETSTMQANISSLKAITDENNRLKSNLLTCNETVAKLKDENKTLFQDVEDSIKSVAENKKSYEKKIKELENRSLELETQKIHFETYYNTCKAENSKLKKLNSDHHSRIEDLNDSVLTKKNEIDLCTLEKNNLNETFTRELNSLKTTHSAQLQQKENEISECQHSLESKTHEMKKVEESYATLQKQMKDLLTGEANNLKTELLQTQLFTLQQEFDMEKLHNEEFQHQIKTLQESLRIMADSSTNYNNNPPETLPLKDDRDVMIIDEKLLDPDPKITEESPSYRNMETDQMSLLLVEKEKKIELLESQLSNAYVQIQKLEKEFEDCQQDRDSLKEINRELQAENMKDVSSSDLPQQQGEQQDSSSTELEDHHDPSLPSLLSSYETLKKEKDDCESLLFEIKQHVHAYHFTIPEQLNISNSSSSSSIEPLWFEEWKKSDTSTLTQIKNFIRPFFEIRSYNEEDDAMIMTEDSTWVNNITFKDFLEQILVIFKRKQEELNDLRLQQSISYVRKKPSDTLVKNVLVEKKKKTKEIPDDDLPFEEDFLWDDPHATLNLENFAKDAFLIDFETFKTLQTQSEIKIFLEETVRKNRQYLDEYKSIFSYIDELKSLQEKHSTWILVISKFILSIQTSEEQESEKEENTKYIEEEKNMKLLLSAKETATTHLFTSQELEWLEEKILTRLQYYQDNYETLRKQLQRIPLIATTKTTDSSSKKKIPISKAHILERRNRFKVKKSLSKTLKSASQNTTLHAVDSENAQSENVELLHREPYKKYFMTLKVALNKFFPDLRKKISAKEWIASLILKITSLTTFQKNIESQLQLLKEIQKIVYDPSTKKYVSLFHTIHHENFEQLIEEVVTKLLEERGAHIDTIKKLRTYAKTYMLKLLDRQQNIPFVQQTCENIKCVICGLCYKPEKLYKFECNENHVYHRQCLVNEMENNPDFNYVCKVCNQWLFPDIEYILSEGVGKKTDGGVRTSPRIMPSSSGGAKRKKLSDEQDSRHEQMQKEMHIQIQKLEEEFITNLAEKDTQISAKITEIQQLQEQLQNVKAAEKCVTESIDEEQTNEDDLKILIYMLYQVYIVLLDKYNRQERDPSLQKNMFKNILNLDKRLQNIGKHSGYTKILNDFFILHIELIHGGISPPDTSILPKNIQDYFQFLMDGAKEILKIPDTMMDYYNL